MEVTNGGFVGGDEDGWDFLLLMKLKSIGYLGDSEDGASDEKEIDDVSGQEGDQDSGEGYEDGVGFSSFDNGYLGDVEVSVGEDRLQILC